jgi:hypothetical protein
MPPALLQALATAAGVVFELIGILFRISSGSIVREERYAYVTV